MSGLSDIEWTDATWNPVSGCRIVTAGCSNCYAMRMAARLQAMGHPAYLGTTRKSGDRHIWTGKIHLNRAVLEAPLVWRKPRYVFANSMSDLFQEAVPFEFVNEIWDVMERATLHTFQVLTKRPDRMRDFLKARTGAPLPNVWLGTSIENRAVVRRVAELRKCPAVVRFISFEPLIGRVGRLSLSGVHWAIVGGESGPRARPMQTSWVEEILSQCKEQDVLFFFKQWGGTNKRRTGRTFRGRTWDDMPARAVG